MRRTVSDIPRQKKPYYNAQITARKRGLTFTLTVQQYHELAEAPCFYCGQEKSSSGIDRVLNEVGYEYYNCVSCCSTCNTMKSAMTVEDFLAHLSGLCSRLPEVIKHLEPLRQLQSQFEAYKNELASKLRGPQEDPKPVLHLPVLKD